MTPITGADALCETLLASGIDTCFANPGTSEMHFVAALDRQPAMRCVLALFEGVATGAADGYARMLGKPAATLLHLGPGLANGLANLHNARRAHSPLVNIVGEHASAHLPLDAPLTSDIAGLAQPMSHWVGTIANADAVPDMAATAIAQARVAPGQVATLILPADAAWNACATPVQAAPPPAARPPADAAAMAAALTQLRRDGPGTVLLLGDAALSPAARLDAHRIAQATGARVFGQQSYARLTRGAGLAPITRLPYAVGQTREWLAGARQVLLLGASAPVGFFGYPDQPGSGLPPGCVAHTVVPVGGDQAGALAQLAAALGAEQLAVPRQALARPALPQGGQLDADAVVATLAALMPEHAILCDESISSGRRLLELTAGCPTHDVLPLNGGAIGIGLPLATGAALACPQRPVLCLQADGSALYTVQALWTQAREQLPVITILLANQSYALLHEELRKVGASQPGHNARRMLDIDTPALDWVHLARGLGVEATRVDTPARLADVLRHALARQQPAPFLIEARIVGPSQAGLAVAASAAA